ncbi:MAG TPA: energy transducer TonB, partial [Gemmatirosa sp.]
TPTTDTPTLAPPDPVPAADRRVGATSVPGAVALGAPAAAPADASVGADTPPRMRNARLPFHYPGALYARRVQGNVTLRLWVDSAGRVRPESTRVAESSGTRLLDSAAVAGSMRLEFTPARHDGRAVAAALLFPVRFRHPAVRATEPRGPGAAPR